MEEIWRPVVGYEGLYEVSSEGRVKSKDMIVGSRYGLTRTQKGRVLKQSLKGAKMKYYYVDLCKNKTVSHYRVNRLVARAFPEICGAWFEGCVINHKNCITTDNRACNLETCTAKYNSNYADCRLKISKAKGKKVNQYTIDGEFIKRWDGVSEAQRALGISHISCCCLGKEGRTTAGGFRWEYA